MSKRKSFGRFTAMSLAGISAISSMAIVSSAEAYPTYVYEFTYGGIKTTPMYYSAIRATADNAYVVFTSQADAQKVFVDGEGFVLGGTLGTDFWSEIDKVYNVVNGVDYNCTNRAADNWQFAEASAFTPDVTPVVPKEGYEKRDGFDGGWTFAFKSMTERDAALAEIAARNKTEYSNKYVAATAQLTKDLSTAVATYNKLQTQLINDAQKEVNDFFRANPSATACTITNTNVSSLDATIGTLISKQEDPANRDATLTISEWATAQRNYVTKKVNELNAVAAQAKKEFTEAYQTTNWSFNNDESKDRYTGQTAAPFVTSYGAVEFGGAIGAYIKYSSADYTTETGTVTAYDLTTDYYRTVGQYINPDCYAFKGEIITESNREGTATSDEIAALLLDSDCWSEFSALIEGKPTDNNNTTESNKDKEEDKEDKKETTTWYPSSASYRIPNSDSISFRGKNNYWYTSSSAAEVYGGGYSGTTLKSNYSDVKGSKTVYFSAMDGKYYTSNKDSYSYLVEENKTATNNTAITDPYYYYYLMSQNGGYINTTTKIDPDAPTIYGSSKRSGWTKILSAVKATKNGTVTIDMNAATTIPSDVIKAAAANNVTIKAVNANGSIFTIDGSDVSYATSIDTTVKYNVKVVSDNLKNKAIKVNKGAVSTTQVVISEDGDLGADATVTVKLSAKRAGYTVKAYRVSSDGRKLTCEAKGTVKSNGSVNLNLDNGGKYVLVLIK